MKLKPKISVIMAVYNTEKYLAEAIESILNQTFKYFELIIINDKSADNSLKIIKEYMKKDNRIILINNKKNSGPAVSRNNGLKIAKGKYIAILDSDDVALPERLMIQFQFLEDNKDIFLIGGKAININELGEKLNVSHQITNSEKIKENLLKENCFYHPTIMFRNEKGIKYRGKFLYAQDYDFYLNLLSKEKKITNIKDILIKYRVNSKSISFSKRGKQFLFSENAKKFYFQRIKYGKDDYSSFNPKDILNVNLDSLQNKELTKEQIWASFMRENIREVRDLSKKYINAYGYFNKILIYYVLSFLGKGINKFLIKFK